MDRGKLLQRLAVRLGLRDAAPAGGAGGGPDGGGPGGME